MKLADIEARAHQRPFRPFALETVGGPWVEVQSEADIFLPPRRADLVIVFDPTDRLFILALDQISAIESK
jgi:hypothetical protein